MRAPAKANATLSRLCVAQLACLLVLPAAAQGAVAAAVVSEAAWPAASPAAAPVFKTGRTPTAVAAAVPACLPVSRCPARGARVLDPGGHHQWSHRPQDGIGQCRWILLRRSAASSTHFNGATATGMARASHLLAGSPTPSQVWMACPRVPASPDQKGRPMRRIC